MNMYLFVTIPENCISWIITDMLFWEVTFSWAWYFFTSKSACGFPRRHFFSFLSLRTMLLSVFMLSARIHAGERISFAHRENIHYFSPQDAKIMPNVMVCIQEYQNRMWFAMHFFTIFLHQTFVFTRKSCNFVKLEYNKNLHNKFAICSKFHHTI